MICMCNCAVLGPYFIVNWIHVVSQDSRTTSNSTSTRLLSSASLPLKEALSVLLHPVLDLLAGARDRPYLSQESVRASLEVVTTVAKLVLPGQSVLKEHQKGEWNCLPVDIKSAWWVRGPI